MGQYQQWLYYQEADHRLQADLEALEIELAHVQEQAHALEQTAPSIDNVIIRTLVTSLNERTRNPDTVLLTKRPENSSRLPNTPTASSHETISPALYGWGGLPNFAQVDIQQPLPQSEDAISLTPHPEMALLPEDMAAFFDAHDQTAPQIALPWWLGKVTASASNVHSEHPIDQESLRTNTQVQRWRERWGRPASTDLADAEEQRITPSDSLSTHKTTRQTNPQALSDIYAKLKAQDIEQFYAGYLWWKMHQRSVTLQEQQAALQQEIAANTELMEMVHPPAIALATMARLQASGMSDIDLLDRMLEKGESWLDRTMQRLDYCEQLNFVIDDYTQWCRNALEGAYDWIDSMREGAVSPSTEVPSNTATNATEELLLQKLTSEEEEQAVSPATTQEPSPSTLQEPASTLEGPSTQISEDTVDEALSNNTGAMSGAPFNSELGGETPAGEVQSIVETSFSDEENLPEEQPSQLSQEEQVSQSVEIDPVSDSPVEEPITHENLAPESQEEQVSQSVEISHASDSPDEEAVTQENIAPDSQSDEISHASDTEDSLSYRMDSPDKKPSTPVAEVEHAERSIPAVTLRRKRNFLQRLVAMIWRK